MPAARGEAHGLTSVEQAVMERHDAGMPRWKIARVLGLSMGRIHSVISTYSYRPTEMKTTYQAAARSSRQLADACLALAARSTR